MLLIMFGVFYQCLVELLLVLLGCCFIEKCVNWFIGVGESIVMWVDLCLCYQGNYWFVYVMVS